MHAELAAAGAQWSAETPCGAQKADRQAVGSCLLSVRFVLFISAVSPDEMGGSSMSESHYDSSHTTYGSL